jgi:hypothetical protein
MIVGAALTMLALGLAPSTAAAGPAPGTKQQPYRLFARSTGFIATNRVFYGLGTRGEIGADSSGTGTTAGGNWPRGTQNSYMFNSGFQFAGIIRGTKPANPWGGDTSAALLFDASGTHKHGAEVMPIYNGQNAADVASWPEVAKVPIGDDGELLYDPLLRGQVNASQGDVYWISWDGDPAFIAQRPHPLGIMVEHRGVAWNYPSGNEDILYFIITYYNVTSLDPAAYASHRPAMRDLLIEQAQKFHALNNAKFGITLPTAGYTIDQLFAAYAADPDVGPGGGGNYSGVNLPFAMGFAYHGAFSRPTAWIFDPAIFAPPFFPGIGFVGMKYLKGPEGPGEIQLFSNTCNGGCLPDPGQAKQVWRYLAGKNDVNVGDQACTIVSPDINHVCFVQKGTGVDIRMFESAKSSSLAPGASASVVIAFVHAAPVLIPGFAPIAGTNIDPGIPTLTASVDSMFKYNGANKVDSIAGFLGFTDGNSDGIPQQGEFKVRTSSLYGKALVAQTVFDNKFLLPFSPEPPEFFLIPGDAQVTILWKPSASETSGDPYFAVAGSATTTTPSGTVANSLYDPNYRRFDVEGYRLYRGRLDAPGSLYMLKQWDYNNTTFKDYGGLVVEGGNLGTALNCAPEIAVTTACRAAFTTITPGVTSTVSFSYDLVGPLVQVNYGNRDKLATGGVVLISADTAITPGTLGSDKESRQLRNTGVPFIYTDTDVRNGVRYYYAVTAFDVNSIRSSPSSLESAKVSKQIVVGAPAGNIVNTATIQQGVFGRTGLLTDNAVPTFGTDGRFSKKFPPSNSATVSLAAFAPQLLVGSGEVSIRYDSTNVSAIAAGSSVTATEWYTITSAAGATVTSRTYTKSGLNGAAQTVTGTFDAIAPNGPLAAQYGGDATYKIPGAFSITTAAGAYWTGISGRGCANAATGFRSGQCYYNGPRWFIGDQETKANPTTVSPVVQLTGATTAASFGNAGELTGVVAAHHPDAYGYINGVNWRDHELYLSPFVSAADYRLYWGAAGKVDSVVDLTHNTRVPFDTRMVSSWGVLNGSDVSAVGSQDKRAELTATDFGCVAGPRTFSQSNFGCTNTATSLVQTAVPGPMAFFVNGTANALTAAAASSNGFGLYIKGRVFMFQLTGGTLPTAGTAWTMRDYTGAISGGNGAGGDFGAYAYTAVINRPFNAPGAAQKFAFTVLNEKAAVTDAALALVHTVPDPYYVTSAYDRQVVSKVINFVKVPTGARIRIYTTSGILVRILDAAPDAVTGTVTWDVRNRSNQFVASGVYFYHIEAEGKSRVGRLTVVNFAQ